MAQKRLTRKLTDVIAEVEKQLKAHYGVTQKELDAWRDRAKALSHKFPISSMIQIEAIWSHNCYLLGSTVTIKNCTTFTYGVSGSLW